MDPFVLSVVAIVGASAAVVARLRRVRAAKGAEGGAKQLPAGAGANGGDAAVKVSDVLTYLGDEYWLAGEIAVMREGAAVVRLFSAPERGRERWVALPRDGRSVWVLFADPEMGSIGWPGVEVPSGGRVLRRFEYGNAALAVSGELPSGAWEGMGRFALFRAHDAVAVAIEGPGAVRLALVGKEIPRQLVQKMG